MKKIAKYFFSISLLISSLSIYGLPTAKLTIRVVDETGEPVINAKAGMSISTPKISGAGSDSTNVRGFTDSNGLYTVRGATEKYIGITVKKEGYYKTSTNYQGFTGASGILGFRRWEPWNPTIDVVIKKMINPIPMYVAEIDGKSYDDPAILPSEGEFFGYDLIAKDWVVPHGQGLHSDFIFKIDVNHYTSLSDFDKTMTLQFSNPDDGIQSFYAFRKGNSVLRLPHHAPLKGYNDKLVVRSSAKKGKVYKSTRRKDQNYFFRVRTKRDNQGNIIDAYYGKIHGNIGSSMPRENKKGKIYFTYYLNPNNNDTNVEFASEKNLFPEPKGHRGRYWFNP